VKKQLLTIIALLFASVVSAQTDNVGIGNLNPSSKLTLNGSFSAPYNQITASTYTMNTNDYYVVYNGAAAGQITLPTSVTGGGTTAAANSPSTGRGANLQGRLYYIKNTTAAQTLTITPAGTETIDGNATITVAAGQSVQIVSTGLTGTAATWEVVTFNSTTSAGCKPGYMLATLGTNQMGINGATDVILNSTLSSSGITGDGSGVFTLTAGNTYSLEASIYASSFSIANGFIYYQWVDAISNVPFSGVQGGSIAPTYGAGTWGTQTVAQSIITPLTNRTVKLRIMGSGGTCNLTGGVSYGLIRQLNACPGSGGGSGGPTGTPSVQHGFATRAISGTQIANNTPTIVLFTGKEWDQGSVFTPATGNFAVAQAGKYVITGSAFLNISGSLSSQGLSVYKNNAWLVSGNVNAVTVGSGNGMVVNYIADLVVGDVIDLRVTSGPSNPAIIQASFAAIKVDGTSSGSSSAATASNGLTATANNVTLGGTLSNATDIATAGNNLTISGTGNVGIGTTTPVFKLHTVGGYTANERSANDPFGSFYFTRKSRGTTASPASVQSGDVIGGMLMSGYTGNVSNPYSGYNEISSVSTENWTSTASGGAIRFATTLNGTTGPAERLRIDQNGSVIIGGTIAITGSAISAACSINNQYGFLFSNNANGNNSAGLQIQAGSNLAGNIGTGLLQFVRGGDGAGIGGIIQNTLSTVAYLTSSDRRLKEHIKPTMSGLSTIMKLDVRDYNYIGDKTLSTGLIAQDAYKIVPSVVHVGGQDVKKDPWGIDYGKLTPYLIKAVQEQQIKIDNQQAEIETLKAQNAKFTAEVSEMINLKTAMANSDAIAAVNGSVTQELARQVEELKKQNTALAAKAAEVDELKKAVADMRSELNKLLIIKTTR